MSDERDDIRARVDIVDLITSEGVQLKKVGKNYTGLCPFHADKRPSFSVSAEAGRYRCWSCGESGDVFTWVMKRQNVDFVEALRQLAELAGVTLRRNPDMPRTDRARHESAMSEALIFFREQFARSSVARDYCIRRGLGEDVLSFWEIGYAPDVGEALAMTLKKKGVSLTEARDLFLVDRDASSGFFDKFRGRLMFPIRDERGNLVGFGGRLLGDGHPKYINSGDTPLYRKSRVLYGLDRARDTLNKTRHAVLCEGYVDVIACHTAGITGALASLGTSLTEDHARLLKRWADVVTVLYDADSAGQKAADRAIEVLRTGGLQIKIAGMNAGEDPDSVLRKQGPEALRKVIEDSLTTTAFRLRRLEAVQSPSEDGFWTAVIDVLAEAETELELDRHLLRLAAMYPGTRDVDRAAKTLRTRVLQTRDKRFAPKVVVRRRFAPPEPVPEIRTSLLGAERIIFRAFLDPALRQHAFMVIRKPELFESGTAQLLANAIAASFAQAPPGEVSAWLDRVEPPLARQALTDLSLDAWVDPFTEATISDALMELRNRMAKRRRIADLQSAGAPEAKDEIVQRLRALKSDPNDANKDAQDGL